MRIKNVFTISALAALSFLLPAYGQERKCEVLTQWEFRHGHEMTATEGWEKVEVPHDWAIYGPFSRDNDIQEVAVTQNFETVASVKTGRTGGLPYVGKGCYRRTIGIDKKDGCRYVLLFDGAMSEAQVKVNGKDVCFWPYGYASFWCDITSAISNGENDLHVLLENRPQSSRWYPGAGLYRKVRLLTLPEVHIPVWGTYITTPYVSEEYASVRIRTEIEGIEEGGTVRILTVIKNPEGKEVARKEDLRRISHGAPAEQHLTVDFPELWSPENPALYTAETSIYTSGDELSDIYKTTFGIRNAEFRADKGFFLNGKLRKFRGVCLHHDLGPLGAAVNKAAIRRQLEILKDMGCDAIRTSHNMPAEELVELCDEMGFMLMVEPFDEWDVAKCENGYHRFFGEWAEKDMVNMLRHFRNNPSVVMWSIGNEVPTQWTEGGYKIASWLQSICHREDPTRPVTCGMDQFDAVVNNGFAAALDIPGFNYKPLRYTEAYSKLPQNLILGSETASTVSSRGIYHFPAESGSNKIHSDHQSSSYDNEYCYWSNIPDIDFAADEDLDWVTGQFVWTGFDYLGEPSPYDTDAWPNHSSVFGIVDLASIPKDRYWLYRSIWNTSEPTLHILPHWNWKGREGETTPVHVYTSYPEAELFINGVSQGRRKKADSSQTADIWTAGYDDSTKVENGVRLMSRYRLMWNETVWEPGELKVVAYDMNGSPAMEKIIRTAGKPYALVLHSDRPSICADGQDLSYVNVSVIDRNGNPVPDAGHLIKIEVSGAGKFLAAANGDPTCLEPFHIPQMHLFSGQLTAIIRSTGSKGAITVKVKAPGLKSAELTITSE